MNEILRLAEISKKKNRLIIGLMSGTSMDGLDVAVCNFEGHGAGTKVNIIAFNTISYPTEIKGKIKEIFGKKDVDLEKVCVMNAFLGHYHADIINKSLKNWNILAADVDLIASHGQTIYHAPKAQHQIADMPDATLQIGDGDHIAVKTGVITLSDFRQKHVAAGGEGAPLAVYGDYLIFSSPDENRIMLNIGGIANFTYLPASLNAEEVFSTDVGPGNTIMDAFVQHNYPGKFFDDDAEIARSGTAHDGLLSALIAHPFFKQDFPKTTGPEVFNLQYLSDAIASAKINNITNADILATLCKFSAKAIADAITKIIEKDLPFTIYLSGGGMHNPLLLTYIKQFLPKQLFKDTGELGINPDAKEAVLFATLANECIAGKATTFGRLRSKIPSVTMGKISLPN